MRFRMEGKTHTRDGGETKTRQTFVLPEVEQLVAREVLARLLRRHDRGEAFVGETVDVVQDGRKVYTFLVEEVRSDQFEWEMVLASWPGPCDGPLPVVARAVVSPYGSKVLGSQA